ncbi:MAG: hypothetical protein GY702_01990 [Desulfobulbaceae bacterium]|nr:hypothetical protein [Desulfobulbaceae bacterium]
MAKIGRNEKCPCRSGKKYKHCCARKQQNLKKQPSPEDALKITLMSGVEEIQADAVAKKAVCKELGVFFFFSNSKGDAWLMEMTACDCVQLASEGQLLEPPIDENAETIEINWSHMYTVRNKNVELTAYEDKSVSLLKGAPSRELSAAMRRIHRKFSQEQLSKVHLESAEQVPSA